MVRHILVTAAAICPLVAAARDIHVATDGRNTADGSPAAPVATLQRAVELARQTAAGEARRIILGGGTHYLPGPVRLTAEDSGLHVEPARGTRPRVVAGRPITAWQPWQNGLVRCDLKTLGLGNVPFRELYWNGQRQTLARWPNADPRDPIGGGWLYAEATVEKGSSRRFRAAANSVKPWRDLSQAEVFFYHRYNYYNTIVGVQSADAATREVNLAADTYDGIEGGGAERYYFQNLLEELDTPGEWYLDRRDSVLYFYPPGDPSTGVVEVPTADYAFELAAGTHDVSIVGLAIEVARRGAVIMRDTSGCAVIGCTVRNTGADTRIGGWGPWEDCAGVGVFGGRDNRVYGCDISEVGSHGVKLTGGDDQTLTAAGNIAENNLISRTGFVWKQGCGVRLEGVGNRFQRNTVHHCPRFAVIFGGHDHLIEQNHLHHLDLETHDTGAIYTGGRDGVTPRGCRVRQNLIHDVYGFGRENGRWTTPSFCWGIYLDDLGSGVEVFGNVVVGVLRAGVHIHNGRDNRIENNVLVDGHLQQVEFNGWARLPNLAEVERNWQQRRERPEWRRRFPELFAEAPADWVQMSGNRIRRNILVASRPNAAVYRMNSLPLARTEFDHNLVWCHGRPVPTGHVTVTKVGERELCPTPDFEPGAAGQLPKPWGWYIRPNERTSAALTTAVAHSGRQSLQVTCAGPPQTPPQYAMLKTDNLPIVPGRGYLLTAWFRATRPGFNVNLVAQSYRAGQHHWARETSAKVGTTWQKLELPFKVPGPGEPGHLPTMTDLYIRLDFRETDGSAFVDDLSLREAESSDEWTGWQAIGQDVHSKVADPLFVDAAAGNYRLRPESPALALGFEPIPFERIGIYADPHRASWPAPPVRVPGPGQ